MYFTDLLITSLALASVGVAAPASAQTSLYQAMKARGRQFLGTALTIRNEPQEVAILKQNMNSITPENAMKWDAIEPSRNGFTFTDADRYVQFAKDNQLEIHCHTLVWHSQLPAWVSAGRFDNATLISIMENHIQTLAGRYKDSCTRWDVVNEALNEDGTYRQSVWYNTIGEAFLPIAFRFAAKYSPKSKLYYNDYNIDYPGSKNAGAVRIAKLIQSYGVRIDGVGYQGHLASEKTPTSGGPAPDQSTLETALRSVANLGLSVAYTEIDIRMNTPASATKMQVQSDAYKRVARACLAVQNCVGMTVWGISDKYSWIPSTFAGEGAADIWDNNYQVKPAYAGFLTGITN